MSSTRGSPMLRNLMVVCLAALAAGCTSTDLVTMQHAQPAPITPTEQFAITVSQAPDEILLAPHGAGLSPAQAAALGDLVQRWRDAGAETITIRSPSGGAENVYRSVAAIQQALEQEGVGATQVRVASYDPGNHANPPIAVGFLGYKAQGPQCGHNWADFTKSGDNLANNNFGCANTANIAAMIANPGDLLAPRPVDPPDAGRRETVIGKYRQGVVTSTPKDTQATGAVSTTVGQ
jgi:pilus assembly protein CpaD